MTATQLKIVGSAIRAAAALLPIERTPGYCLKAARQIVENALGKADGWFYTLMQPGATRNAATAESQLRAKGWAVAVEQAQPGDLVFNGRVSLPDGHVGILIGPGVVLENTTAQRGVRLGGALALTPLGQFGPVTTVIRIPEL